MVRWHVLIPALVLLLLPVAGQAQSGRSSRPPVRRSGSDSFIVACARPCASISTLVESLGGRVTRRFEHVDGIAAEIPVRRLPELLSAAGRGAVVKDALISRPRPRPVEQTAVDVASLRQLAATRGSAYSSTGFTGRSAAPFDALGGAGRLHARGMKGQDVVIAVIDDGIAMDPLTSLRSDRGIAGGWVSPIAGVRSVRPVLGNRLIGGESLVSSDVDPSSATRIDNDAHGTVIAVLAAGDGALVASNREPFIQSMRLHLPERVIACGPVSLPPCSADSSTVPITGTAPGAKLYAIKVFPNGSGEGLESDLMAGLDRAITLRRNYNRGMPVIPVGGNGTPDSPFVYDSLRIDVVNMSFGGPTAFAGRDMFDQLVLDALSVGIVPVAAAANDGPAAMTVTSPGTSFGSLTVGAIAAAGTDRLWEDIDFGVGIGLQMRPSDRIQTANFSSRGPTADGRSGPNIAALGTGNLHIARYGVTTSGTLDFCNWQDTLPGTCQATAAISAGTSYATPLVAGAAALLRREFPHATATQIRNALQAAANSGVFGDNSGAIDHGEGALDVVKAYELLRTGQASNTLPEITKQASRQSEEPADALGRGGRSVARNIAEAGFRPIEFTNNVYTQRVGGLTAGQTAQIFIPSDALTTRLTVELADITSDLPIAKQNALVGERALVQLIDAPTGWLSQWEFAWQRVSVGAVGWSVAADAPQTGLLRLAIQGDFRNAGRIAATVTIRRESAPKTPASVKGRVKQDDFLSFDFEVPAGTQRLTVATAWEQNWSRYPTNDIDIYVIDPADNLMTDGVTLDSPERVAVDTPAPGRWTVVIVGYKVYRRDGQPDDPTDMSGRVDDFELRVTADGERLRPRR